jgi:hypothetical protein
MSDLREDSIALEEIPHAMASRQALAFLRERGSGNRKQKARWFGYRGQKSPGVDTVSPVNCFVGEMADRVSDV